MAVRVLLVDDHTLVRAGLRALLVELPNTDVVGEAVDGREALRLVRELRPDIALVDVAMPGMNGLDTAERLLAESPETKVVILSMHANEEYVLRARRVGAHGYLLKDANISELEQALRSVMGGGTYIAASVSVALVESYASRTGKDRRSPLERLTPRQREVFRLIAEGKNTKAIAYELGVTTKTVETHRTQLMRRLQIQDVASLVRLAIREGLVGLEG